MTVTSNIHVGLTAWASGQTITIGTRRSSTGSDSNPHAYQATTSGTTGSTAPNIITTGTISDGGIIWKWLSKIDFTSYTAWTASIPSTLTQPIVGNTWNDGPVNNPSIGFNGFTTSSTNTITLQTAPGESFYDNPNVATNKLTYNPSYGVSVNSSSGYYACVGSTCNYTTIRGFMIYVTGYRCVAINGNITIDKCMIVDYSGGDDLGDFIAGKTIAVNCLFIVENGVGQGRYGSNFTNCTFVVPSNYSANNEIWDSPYSGTNFYNCAFLGFTSVGRGIGGSNNAFDASTVLFGSNGVANVPRDNTTFINAGDSGNVLANMDFRTVAGSKLIDAGMTITAGQNTTGQNVLIPTTDILGTTRPQGSAWDIGCYEFKVSVSHRRSQLIMVS